MSSSDELEVGPTLWKKRRRITSLGENDQSEELISRSDAAKSPDSGG